MNVVKIMGGLGNQLFGYVFAKHLERCGEVGLDIDWFNSPDNHSDRFPERQFLLDKFTTEYKLAEPGRRSFVDEKDYDKTKGYGNGYFWGYWQKGSYFKGLKLDLRLKEGVIDSNIQDIGQALKEENSVAVHVRRGDYAQFNNWMLDEDYYHRAMDTIREKVTDPVFFFFSDEPRWCLKLGANLLHYDELDDFYLMSQCKHNIIANSTYSFWAAMLNDNPDKVVVYPEDWKCGQRPVDFEGWTGV